MTQSGTRHRHLAFGLGVSSEASSNPTSRLVSDHLALHLQRQFRSYPQVARKSGSQPGKPRWLLQDALTCNHVHHHQQRPRSLWPRVSPFQRHHAARHRVMKRRVCHFQACLVNTLMSHFLGTSRGGRRVTRGAPRQVYGDLLPYPMCGETHVNRGSPRQVSGDLLP